jgi:hypothetical protein
MVVLETSMLSSMPTAGTDAEWSSFVAGDSPVLETIVDNCSTLETIVDNCSSAPLKAFDQLGESPDQGNVTTLNPTW